MPECNRCGKCCTYPRFMGTLFAIKEDLLRWEDEGREDILSYANIFYDKEGEPSSADLWVKHDGEELSRCPFVRKDRNKTTHSCTIYDTRPTICQEYPAFTKNSICDTKGSFNRGLFIIDAEEDFLKRAVNRDIDSPPDSC